MSPIYLYICICICYLGLICVDSQRGRGFNKIIRITRPDTLNVNYHGPNVKLLLFAVLFETPYQLRSQDYLHRNIHRVTQILRHVLHSITHPLPGIVVDRSSMFSLSIILIRKLGLMRGSVAVVPTSGLQANGSSRKLTGTGVSEDRRSNDRSTCT